MVHSCYVGGFVQQYRSSESVFQSQSLQLLARYNISAVVSFASCSSALVAHEDFIVFVTYESVLVAITPVDRRSSCSKCSNDDRNFNVLLQHCFLKLSSILLYKNRGSVAQEHEPKPFL